MELPFEETKEAVQAEEPSFVINRAQMPEVDCFGKNQPEISGETAAAEEKKPRRTKMGAEAVAMEAAR